jgi:DNA-binding PadR family transcriptional regulator
MNELIMLSLVARRSLTTQELGLAYSKIQKKSLGLGNIYRIVEILHRSGFIEVAQFLRRKGAPTRVHKITESGKKEIEQFVRLLSK